MSLPGHYTPQLFRSLVLPFPGTSSKISWDFLPRLPRCPSVPPPLLPCRAGFGSVQPVTPLINTYRTTDILLVSVASPISSAPLPSLRVCRPRPPGPRPSGMVGRPYPQFSISLFAVPPSQRFLSACQTWSIATLGQWRLPSRHPKKNAACTFNSALSLFLLPLHVVPSPLLSVPPLDVLHFCHRCFPLPFSPLLVTPSGRPLHPPTHQRWWEEVDLPVS